jgi:hypothetical protein
MSGRALTNVPTPRQAQKGGTMSSFAVDHAKARAYDQLAELAITAKIKTLRAGESDDIKAILDQYFQASIALMRRTGLLIKFTEQSALRADSRRAYDSSCARSPHDHHPPPQSHTERGPLPRADGAGDDR